MTTGQFVTKKNRPESPSFNSKNIMFFFSGSREKQLEHRSINFEDSSLDDLSF